MRRTMLRMSRRRKDEWLTWEEIAEVLGKSDLGETTLIRRRPPPAASGAPDDDFQVDLRKAQVVTLAHMFAMASDLHPRTATAFDVYKHWLDLPILIHKQKKTCCKDERERQARVDECEAPAPTNNKRARGKWCPR